MSLPLVLLGWIVGVLLAWAVIFLIVVGGVLAALGVFLDAILGADEEADQ